MIGHVWGENKNSQEKIKRASVGFFQIKEYVGYDVFILHS
jgi:hypothetical protein